MERSKYFLLFCGILLGVIAKVTSQDECPLQRDHACLNCTTGIDCTYDPPIYLECDEGGRMVCGENADSTAVFCSTSVTPENEVCLCQDELGGYLADGYYEDPYSNHESYVSCNLAVPSYIQCPVGQLFFDETGHCTTIDDCTEEGNFEIPSMCGKYQSCILDGPGQLEYVIIDCEAGEIFDSNSQECVNPAGNSSVVCAAGADFLVPNPYACDVFHICEEGSQNYSDTRCCDTSEIFDDPSNECLLGQCSPLTGLCIEQYWERNACDRCLTNGTQYATDTPCSKYFFLCVDNGQGEILPKLTECPDSSVFDGSTNSCVANSTCV